MKPMLDYQQKLLDTLRDPASPRLGVVASIPQAGVRHVIEVYVHDASSTGTVLILSPAKMFVEQWAHRLREHGDMNVTVLDSASAALSLLEEPSETHGRVLLTTYSKIAHGPSSRALSELNFNLIVHDAIPRSFPEKVHHLNSRAQRVIALVDRISLDTGPQWPLIFEVTNKDASRDADHAAVVDIPYELTNKELALKTEIVHLFSKYSSLTGLRVALPSDSRPALHAQLLNLVSQTTDATNPDPDNRPSKYKDLTEKAWTLLDQFEGSVNIDSRLDALDRVLERERATQARCVIVAATITDVRYITDHLANTGNPSRAVFSSRLHTAGRKFALEALKSLGPGESMVATHAICTLADGWPPNPTVILWKSPKDSRIFGDLIGALEGIANVKILQLKEVNRRDGTV